VDAADDRRPDALVRGALVTLVVGAVHRCPGQGVGFDAARERHTDIGPGGEAVTPHPHWARGAFAVALLFFVHEALLRGLRIDGVRPDILLGAGIVAAVVAGPELGSVMAFVLEVLADLFVNTPFGLSALAACTVAFLAGTVRSSLGTHTRLAVPTLTFLGSMAAVLLWALVGTVLGLPALLHPHLVTVSLVIATVNLAVCAPLALLMRWVFVPAAERAYAT